MCVLFYLQLSSETFLILRRSGQDMMINVYWSTCKVRVILTRFKLNLNFFDRFSKNAQISNSIKIRPMGAELFHADGWTDGRIEMRSLIFAFRNF